MKSKFLFMLSVKYHVMNICTMHILTEVCKKSFISKNLAYECHVRYVE